MHAVAIIADRENVASTTNTTAAQSSTSQSHPAPTTEAAPSASPVPLTLNAASLFPLTQTAEEILAAAPPTPTTHTIPSAGPKVTLTSAAVSPPPEFSSPHRRRAWQDAARLAVSKSKIVQQLREERASRGQPVHPNLKASITLPSPAKSKGGVLLVVETQAQERQRVQVANMMTGRLLRAHKQARGRGCDDQAGSAWRIKDTEQGFTFERVNKDGKTPSQYSSDLFGAKKSDAAAPRPAVQAPEWAVAAATAVKKS